MAFELTIHIELPERTVSNARTRTVAAAFELGCPGTPAATSAAGRAAGVTGAATRCLLPPTRLVLSGGQLAYLVGASGSGKSQVLAALARTWPGPVVAGALGEAHVAGRHRAAVLDQLGLAVEPTLRLLCSAGLGEARLWLMPAGCLSAGQADRLALARLYARAERAARPAGRRGDRRTRRESRTGRRDAGTRTRGDGQRERSAASLGRALRPTGRRGEDETGRERRTGRRDAETAGRGNGGTAGRGDGPAGPAVLVLIDEFGARLDRLTARVLSANLRRWLEGMGGRAAAVAATAHDDLADALRADWIWVKTDGELVVMEMQSAKREMQSAKCKVQNDKWGAFP